MSQLALYNCGSTFATPPNVDQPEILHGLEDSLRGNLRYPRLE
jgi:hypothetical protein